MLIIARPFGIPLSPRKAQSPLGRPARQARHLISPSIFIWLSSNPFHSFPIDFSSKPPVSSCCAFSRLRCRRCRPHGHHCRRVQAGAGGYHRSEAKSNYRMEVSEIHLSITILITILFAARVEPSCLTEWALSLGLGMCVSVCMFGAVAVAEPFVPVSHVSDRCNHSTDCGH